MRIKRTIISDHLNDILAKLRSLSNPENVAGMARFGISADKTFGITMPVLRGLGKEIRKYSGIAEDPAARHKLASELWDSEYHEARILASIVDDFKQVDEAQMEKWVADFDSWDICDQCIINLFEDMGALAWRKAVEWSARERGFEKRAGFVLMARLAVNDKKAADIKFEPFFPIIVRESTDNRNFVKKAINWALRQIGKRNKALNKKAIEVAAQIQSIDNKSAKWIAGDALRELTGAPVRKRLDN